MEEYEWYCDIVNTQHANNQVHEYLQHTSSTRNTLLNDKSISRKLTPGLKIFGNKFSPAWNKIMNEGISRTVTLTLSNNI